MVGFRSVIGAAGEPYDILDLPLTFAGWKTALSTIYELESTDSQDDPLIHASRRFFAEFCRGRWDIVLCAAVVYLCAVFFLPKLLFGDNVGNGKSQFSSIVRTPFALWNGGLAVFSIIGFCHVGPELYDLIMERDSFCSDLLTRKIGTGFRSPGAGMFLFIFSKLPELCDTFFLIIKNRPVRLLQWYHHVSVMLFCWHALGTEYAPSLYFGAMNYAVHSVMYTYFAIYTQFNCSRKFLKKVGPIVTLMQTSQMVVGIFVNAVTLTSYYTGALNNHGTKCHVVDSTMYAAMVMYLSYFILFAKLFYDSVVKTKAVMADGCCKTQSGPNTRKAVKTE